MADPTFEETDLTVLGEPELTTDEKVDYLFRTFRELEPLLRGAAEQVGPMLESVSKNKLLKGMLGL